MILPADISFQKPLRFNHRVLRGLLWPPTDCDQFGLWTWFIGLGWWISECPASAHSVNLCQVSNATQLSERFYSVQRGSSAGFDLMAAGSPLAPQPRCSWQGEFDALQNMGYIDLFSIQQMPKPHQLMWLQKVKDEFGDNYQLPTNILRVVWNADMKKEEAQWWDFVGTYAFLQA